MSASIEIKDLAKVYKLTKKQMSEFKTKKNQKMAVEQLDLTAVEGEIYGLLGPNGAGKTTTLRCIATLLKPTAGTIQVCGKDTVKDAEDVRRTIGFLTNEMKLDSHFSPNYLFRFFGRLYGMQEKHIEERRKELFTHFEMLDFQDKRVEELSTGMKQKAAIAVSLVHDPKVIIFDEPTNGLDIVTARGVTEYLKVLKKKGKLIIISTHIMSEAEKLCDRIGIIIHGRKAIEGTTKEILEKTGTGDLEDAFFKMYQQQGINEEN